MFSCATLDCEPVVLCSCRAAVVQLLLHLNLNLMKQFWIKTLKYYFNFDGFNRFNRLK